MNIFKRPYVIFPEMPEASVSLTTGVDFRGSDTIMDTSWVSGLPDSAGVTWLPPGFKAEIIDDKQEHLNNDSF